jgi:hypothetical protein
VPTSLPSGLLDRLESATDVFAKHIDDLIHEYGADNIKAAFNAYYDKHLAPLDVPYVPDSAEPFVIDQPAKLLFGRVLDFIHAKVHREG